jgi:uncharacterized protein YdaU (DUF1376 family)
MKSPAFQFYPADFIMGTSMMTAEEVGGYIRLLCHQWSAGLIPNKVKLLKQLTGVFDDESIETILTKFVEDEEGNLYNERLENIRKGYEDYVEKQKINGSKGGRPKNPKKPKPLKNETQNEPNLNPNITSSSSSSSSIPNTNAIPKEKKISFKNWTEQQFKDDIKLHRGESSLETLNNFFEYWNEKSASGKMKFQSEKTWETKKRLARWELNNKKPIPKQPYQPPSEKPRSSQNSINQLNNQ